MWLATLIPSYPAYVLSVPLLYTAYFKKLASQIGSLDYGDATSAGRKIVQLIQALEDVQEFHQLQSSLQIRQFLDETCLSLRQVRKTPTF